MRLQDIIKFGDENDNFIDENQFDCFQISPAIFLIDFGPWKSNTHYNCIAFNFEEGTIKEYDINGEVINRAELILSAK